MPKSRPYIDENGKTDAETYLEGCLDGTYVVGRHIKRLAKKMLKQIREGYKRWHYDADKAIRPVRFIEQFLRITDGAKAGQPLILEPYERCIVELAFGFVDDEGVRRFREVLMVIGRKNGKALSLDTEIPTPDGWRLMRDIHPGDYVFGQDGKPSKVLVESEIFDKPMYLVTFEDGATIKASGDHVWTVKSKKSMKTMSYTPRSGTRHSNYREGGWYETTTAEMAEKFVRVRRDGKGCEYIYRVPMCLPAEYPEKDLPIDPYTLGYWIGDGTTGGSNFTVSDEDVDEAVSIIESLGHACTRHRYADRAITVTIDAGVRGQYGSNTFKNGLRDLGILNDKRIPDVYLQASVEQRWELLRGLMDTDGYCSKAGQCEFTQKSELIVDQLIELCSSLGIKATKRSKEARCNGAPAGTVYQAQFWTDKAHSCFRLKRKHDRLKDQLAPRMSCKSIVNIERIPNEPSKCIAIDNQSHLYLAGRQYTATHNTALLAALNIYMLTSDGEAGAECYNGATTKEQAALCYGTTWDMLTKAAPAIKKRVDNKVIRKGMIEKRSCRGIRYDEKLNYLCTISSNSESLDGLNVHFAVLDELAASKDGGATYQVIKGSMGARKQPMLFMISSNGHVRDGIFDDRRSYCLRWLKDEVEDDRFLGFLYELDSREEIDIPECWPKANPGLGTVKSWDWMHDIVQQGKQNPRDWSEIVTKQFNIPENTYSSFLTYNECHNEATYEFNPKTDRYCTVGFDLSKSGDLSSACAMFMRPGDDTIYEISHSWIAGEQIRRNGNSMRERDAVPYSLWEKAGWLTIVDGDKINQMVVIDWIKDLVSMGLFPRFCGYDSWHVDDWSERELEMMFGKDNFEAVSAYAKVLSPAMVEHQVDLRAKRLNSNNNPLLEWCRSNVQTKPMDAMGNYFPNKKGLKPNKKIDAYMAELYAYIVLKKHWDEYLQLIGWDKTPAPALTA